MKLVRAISRNLRFSLSEGIRFRYLLAVVLLVLLCQSAAGRVLCFGGDGHVAIEAVDAGGDCAEYSDAQSKPLNTLANHDCGNCLDIAVMIDEATQGGPKILLTDPLPSAEYPPPLLYLFRSSRYSSVIHSFTCPNPANQKIVLII